MTETTTSMGVPILPVSGKKNTRGHKSLVVLGIDPGVAHTGYGEHVCRSQASQDLPGEVVLVGAILYQAIQDARGKRLVHDTASTSPKIQAEARAFLHDEGAIAFWCGLVGADATLLAPALRRAAGVPEKTSA